MRETCFLNPRLVFRAGQGAAEVEKTIHGESQDLGRSAHQRGAPARDPSQAKTDQGQDKLAATATGAAAVVTAWPAAAAAEAKVRTVLLIKKAPL